MFIWELLSLLALLAIRVGIPLMVLMLITWWLRRLDRKWQAEPLALPVPAERGEMETDGAERAARRPIIQVPCWVFRACPPERCAKCRVYKAQHPSLPCWRIHLIQEGRLPSGCRTCAIFATTVAQGRIGPVSAGAD